MQSSREEVISSLIKDDPVAQELLAETEASGEAWARGRLQGLQEAAMSILQVRFPILAATPQAQQAIASIQNTEGFDLLHRALLVLPDERAVRILLELQIMGISSDRAKSGPEAIGESYVQLSCEVVIKDDPVVQKLLAEARLEGEIKARKGNIFTVLTIRFSPALAFQAQSVITPFQSADSLKLLFQQLLRVPDEQTARIVLGLPSE